MEDGLVDGLPVVVIRVYECDRSSKPCRVTASGTAYVRCHDGDFALSEVEEQAFLAARQPPLFDRQPVDGSTLNDLDPELVGEFLRSVRERDPHGLGRFGDDRELLVRAGVVRTDRVPTVAGLLAMGVHPQQWFPRFVIQAAAEPQAGEPAGTRARNQRTITGPIPRMLDEALDWAQRTFDTSIVAAADGRVMDRTQYPLVAFRELIANALVHRDLNHWSAGMAIEVRLRRDRLIITNPGGLYGITVERLGHDAVTSARNAQLVNICQHVRCPGSGARVIEALATGLTTVAEALTQADLPQPRYVDAGIRFTAVLYQRERNVAATPTLNATEQKIYDSLRAGTLSVHDLSAALGFTAPNTRKALRKLRTLGLVEQIGGPGQATTYRIPTS
ncbi:ATP-binding protein [Nocardia goodfellowii]